MKNAFVSILFSLGAIVNSVSDWNSPENGNPLVPGYFADPSAIYDSLSETFYIFSTTDGLWISMSSDPAVYSSKDFSHWKLTPLILPGSWPKKPLWAPSVIKNPRITEAEILLISKSHLNNDDILRDICINKDWTKNYQIKKSLVENHKTPLHFALRFLSGFTDKDLGVLAKSKNVSSVISTQARRLLMNKQKEK